MTPAINDLLELAEYLAQREAGRPKQVSLRRSVSTAYYALFHAMAYTCADTLVGWQKPWNVFKPIYRSLDHGAAKNYFKQVLGRNDDILTRIGQAFVTLQEARHRADYDPEASFGRQQVRDYCADARFAVAGLANLSAESRLVLATGLIGRTR